MGPCSGVQITVPDGESPGGKVGVFAVATSVTVVTSPADRHLSGCLLEVSAHR